MKLDKLLIKYSTLGIIGNKNSAKSSLALTKIVELRADYPDLKIAVMGVEPQLFSYLAKHNITIIQSKMDILDLQMKDTILYIDESALFFDTRNKGKEIDKLMRFFDRIIHNNCKLIMSTTRENYFNKFMCSRVEAFLVKEIEYDALVNGTWLKERVKAITSISDYRLQCEKNEYFVVTNKEGVTSKHTFPYMTIFDTKLNNKNLFQKSNKSAEESAEKNAKEKSPFKDGFVRIVEDEQSNENL
jgi:hypothetical protein